MSMIHQMPDDAEATAAPITICPPGKRSKVIVERTKTGTVPTSTATALKWPERSDEATRTKIVARNAIEADKLIKARERAEALSVVLAQPHRAGSDDARLAFPLGRFCARAWPRDPDFADQMFAAGDAYATEVRKVAVAKGFHVAGCASDAPRAPASTGEATPEEIEAKRAEIYGLERTLARTDDELRSVMLRCPKAMVRLCFDHAEPLAHDEDMLKHGLYLLSLHYGFVKRGRHRA